MTQQPAKHPNRNRPDQRADAPPGGGRTAFVLGGGGKLGGYQVGMLRALFERGVTPDCVYGTSIGSIQGAMLAADPTPALLDRLTEFWQDFIGRRVMGVTASGLLGNIARRRCALATQDALSEVVAAYVGERTRIEDLSLPYQCAAASIERAAARYFDSGPLLPALMASAGVPGLWPPVLIEREHYVDGGVVESVPISRAVTDGASTVYVLRMRQSERPLLPATWPWQIGPMSFEISRRHHLSLALNARPPGVQVHILPSGEAEPAGGGNGRSRDRDELAMIERRAASGYRATCEYFEALDAGRAPRLDASANPVARSTLTTSSLSDRSGGPVWHRGPVPEFVTAKHRALFARYDRDGTGRVGGTDVLRVADGIRSAFGHPSDSPKAADLAAAYGDYWKRLAEAADVDPSGTLDQGELAAALGRLAGSGEAFAANILPLVAAMLRAADVDGDGILDPAEIGALVGSFGVGEEEGRTVTRRLDTNGDGVISLDELAEAFRDYYTSDERGRAGNFLFGGLPD